MLRRLFAFLPPSKDWRLPVIGLVLITGAAMLLAGRFLFDEVLDPEGRFAGMLLGTMRLILLVPLAEVGFSIIWD